MTDNHLPDEGESTTSSETEKKEETKEKEESKDEPKEEKKEEVKEPPWERRSSITASPLVAPPPPAPSGFSAADYCDDDEIPAHLLAEGASTPPIWDPEPVVHWAESSSSSEEEKDEVDEPEEDKKQEEEEDRQDKVK